MHPNAAVLSPLVQFLAGLAFTDHHDGSQTKTVSPELCLVGCRDFGLYNARCSHDNKECIHKNEAIITKHQDWCVKATKMCTDLSLRDLPHEDKGLAKQLEYFSWDEKHCWSHEPEWSGYCGSGDHECIRQHFQGIQAHKDDCVSMRREIRSDVHYKNSVWKAAHPSSSAAKTHDAHATLTARAMATPTPGDQTNVAPRSANDHCKCFLKIGIHGDVCAPDDKHCIQSETYESPGQCITDQEMCDKYTQKFKDGTGKTYPAEEHTKTLQARAGAIGHPWDDLGPVIVRTERPETAAHEIEPRTAEATTMTRTGPSTMTYMATVPTTEVVDVETVIVFPDDPSATSSSTTPARTSTSTTVSSTTTSISTGTPMTTISTITGGLNTIVIPMPSAAPVIVVSGQQESWSTDYTTETLWSSVWEPVNTPIATTTKRVVKYVPIDPSQAANPTGKTSSASTARSGAGVMIMAGVGALAACFMML